MDAKISVFRGVLPESYRCRLATSNPWQVKLQLRVYLQTCVTCSMIPPSLACCLAARVVMTSTSGSKENTYGARAGDDRASPRETWCTPPRYGGREYYGYCWCRAH